MPSVSGWQTGTPTAYSVAYSAVVTGTSAVKLKVRLRLQGSGSLVWEYTHPAYGSGVRVGGDFSVNPNTSYYWEAQAYESSTSYSAFEYCGGFTTPSPPVVYPNSPSSLSTWGPTSSAINFEGYVSHPSGLNCYLNAQVYSNSSYTNYVTSFSTSFTSSGSYASGTMTGLSPGTTYYWKAYTTDSNYNNSSTVTVGSFTTLSNNPNPPTNLSTGTPTETSIPFQGMVSHPEGLNVFLNAVLYDSTGTNYITTVSTGFVESNSFAFGSFTGLTPGTTYQWRAYATDTSYRNSSTVVVGTFTTKIDRNPNDPTNLSHTIQNATTVNFSGTVSDLDGQQLYLKAYVYRNSGLTDLHGEYIGSLTTSGGTSSGTINGLAMAKQYWWTAQTVDNGGAKGSSRVYAGTFTTPTDWKWLSAADANGNKIAGVNFSMLWTEWNSFTGLINQTRTAKGHSTYPFTAASQGMPFYYFMFNEAISAINTMQGTYISPKIKGDTAWAGDFNALKNTLNSV